MRAVGLAGVMMTWGGGRCRRSPRRYLDAEQRLQAFREHSLQLTMHTQFLHEVIMSPRHRQAVDRREGSRRCSGQNDNVIVLHEGRLPPSSGDTTQAL